MAYTRLERALMAMCVARMNPTTGGYAVAADTLEELGYDSDACYCRREHACYCDEPIPPMPTSRTEFFGRWPSDTPVHNDHIYHLILTGQDYCA